MRPVKDTVQHMLRRQQLVETIRSKGISDEQILGAVCNVPRHFFLDESQDDLAYVDKAFPIGEGQTISQPYTVAYQTQLLQVKPLERVLEIGTGSGYQAAILAELGAKVFTVERQRRLYAQNEHFHFLRQYSNIRFFFGDGYDGLPAYAPFNKILLTAAAPEIPAILVQQLAVGGLMVLPLGQPGETQRMIRLTKSVNGELKMEAFDLFAFVPMLKGKRD